MNYFDYIEEVELDGLSSLDYLKLKSTSLERFSARNLKSLKNLYLGFKGLMDECISTKIFENLPNITALRIGGCFSNLNLDSLVNLENLFLEGSINQDLNYGLLKNLSNHLQKLIFYIKFDDEQIRKLFYDHTFPCLYSLKIENSKMKKIKKEMFKGFPILVMLLK